LDITKQIDGTPLTRAFGFIDEKEKVLYGLQGILTGVVADQLLNERELLYLDSWLKSQQYLSKDDDVLAILGQVGNILEDGKISQQELIEMQAAIQRILSAIEPGSEKPPEKERKIDQMVGFLGGIASDGVLNDDEIMAMAEWLNKNYSLREVWPVSIVANRVELILEDGVITNEERQDLLETVNQLISNEADVEGPAFEASTEVWEDDIDSLEIAGSMFCLTGDFVSGDCSGIDTMLKCMGADTMSNVNKKTDYLVIGTLASRDWLYTSHGRKIEKALLLKREDSSIKVITERTLLKFIHQM
jgi:NAD-dependent DNA ligase